jgi:hypothetical protein
MKDAWRLHTPGGPSPVKINTHRQDEQFICDGCSVVDPWEHRCHGSKSVVHGVQTYKTCQCLICKENKL